MGVLRAMGVQRKRNGMMKAIRIATFGGPDVMKYEEAPIPEPGPGEALVRVYPTPSVPWDRAPLLRERHLSIFADQWSDWLGTLLTDHARLGDAERCRGGIDQVAAVGVSDARGWRASGWTWDAERRTVPGRVVVADATGRVVGYGLSGFPRAVGGEGGDWHGHFAAAQPVSIVAYALLDDGRTACPLGRWTISP